MLVSIAFSSLVIFLLRKVHAVPPAACHAPFRWDDCGKEPTPVMYYWKPGSRCEVGMWRGCLPNINMFPDEYECVATCIFSMRAGMEDYHSFNELEDDSDETTRDPYDIHYKDTTTEGLLNDTNSTGGNDTESGDDGDDDASTTGDGETSAGTTGDNATGGVTTAGDGGATGSASDTSDTAAGASETGETTAAVETTAAA